MSIKSVSLTEQKINESPSINFESSSSSSTQISHIFEGNVNLNLLSFPSIEKLEGQVNSSERDEQIIDAIAALQLVSSENVSLTFPNGHRYQGEWENGPHGYGKLIFSNQDSEIFYGYEGQWLNGQRHGKGFYKDENFQYYGDWIEGEMHGYGKMATFSSGEIEIVYDGYFLHNTCHGKGSFFTANGSEIKGDFVDGYPDGQVKILLSNNSTFEGEYIEGGEKAKGELVYASGIRFVGELSNFNRNGLGVLYGSPNDTFVTIEGSFVDDMEEGYCVCVLKDGSRFEGMFVQGLIHGRGKWVFAKGSTYEGDFEGGKFHGLGILISDEGDKFEGQFINGLLDGIVHCTNSSKKIILQQFQNGKLQSRKEISIKEYLKFQKNFLTEFAEGNKRLAIAKSANHVKKHKSLNELLDYIGEPSKGSSSKNTKKPHQNIIANQPSQARNETNPKEGSKQKEKKKVENSGKQKEKAVKKDQNTELSNAQEQILTLLNEGIKHMFKPLGRVKRWQDEDILKKMETFNDSGEYKYQGMNLAEKLEMVLFHEGGSMLDPIIFHPNIKNKYVYETDTGIGCYMEIVKKDGSSYQGVLLFGLDKKKSVCYHRMFEPRKYIDFLSLNIKQFFNSETQAQCTIDSFEDAFYVDTNENQLLFSDYIFDLDVDTGVITVQDNRKDIEALVRVLPLKLVTNRMGVMDFHFNSKFL